MILGLLPQLRLLKKACISVTWCGQTNKMAPDSLSRAMFRQQWLCAAGEQRRAPRALRMRVTRCSLVRRPLCEVHLRDGHLGTPGRVVRGSAVSCYVWCYRCCASRKRRNVSAVPAAPRAFFQPLSSRLACPGFSEQCGQWDPERRLAWAGSATHLTSPDCPVATQACGPKSAPFSAPRWWMAPNSTVSSQKLEIPVSLLLPNPEATYFTS